MPKRTSSYHDGFLEDLKNPVAAMHYLNAALAESPGMFLTALRDVADAHQLSHVAAHAGIARETAYRTLSGKGNPTLSTLTGVLGAVGLALKVDLPTAEYLEADEESTEATPELAPH